MADWSRFRGARMGRCSHDSVVTTTNAGIERVVCEHCGNVSVRYIEEAVRIYPDPSEVAEADRTGRRKATCRHCSEPPTFIVPSGYACDQHAWAMAARQDVLGGELWIPIRIDQKSDTLG